MTTFAQPLPLERRISLALAHLRAARYDSNPSKIAAHTAQMNALLDRIASRPLHLIDPDLDKQLTVAGKSLNPAPTAIAR